MESQKTLNCQRNIEKKEQNWRYHIFWLQTIPEKDKNTSSKRYIHPIVHRDITYNIQNIVINLDIFSLLTICSLHHCLFWT